MNAAYHFVCPLFTSLLLSFHAVFYKNDGPSSYVFMNYLNSCKNPIDRAGIKVTRAIPMMPKAMKGKTLR